MSMSAPTLEQRGKEKALAVLSQADVTEASRLASLGVEVRDDITATEAIAQASAIGKAVKVLEAQGRTITDPLNAALKAVRALLSPKVEILKRAKEARVAAVDRWRREENLRKEREAAEVRRKAEAEAAAEAARIAAERKEYEEVGMAPPDDLPLEAPPALIDEAPAPITQVRVVDSPGAPMAYVRRELMVEVLDWSAIATHDPSLLVLNASRAKDLYRQLERHNELNPEDPGRTIPGLRFWKEEAMAVR